MAKFLFFAELSELAKQGEVKLELPASMSIKESLTYLAKALPNAEQLLARLQDKNELILLSKNQQFCSWDEQISDNDEVAFLPPFSGG